VSDRKCKYCKAEVPAPHHEVCGNTDCVQLVAAIKADLPRARRVLKSLWEDTISTDKEWADSVGRFSGTRDVQRLSRRKACEFDVRFGPPSGDRASCRAIIRYYRKTGAVVLMVVSSDVPSVRYNGALGGAVPFNPDTDAATWTGSPLARALAQLPPGLDPAALFVRYYGLLTQHWWMPCASQHVAGYYVAEDGTVWRARAGMANEYLVWDKTSGVVTITAWTTHGTPGRQATEADLEGVPAYMRPNP